MVKNLPPNTEDARDVVISLGGEDPLAKSRATQYCHGNTPVFWPEESHGQRSLVGYSP